MVKTASKSIVLAAAIALRERLLTIAEAVWVFFRPSRLFDGLPWRGIWEAKERRLVMVMSQAWMILASIAYLAHYFFFDRVQHLEPLLFWLYFRLAMCCILLATAILYASPWIHRLGPFYRFPSAMAMWLIVYTQALVTQWYSVDAWVFCFMLLLVSLLILRMSALGCFFYIALVVISIWWPLWQAGVPESYIISGVIVTLSLAVAFSSAHLYGIRRFLQEQENLRQQRELIKLRLVIADQIRLLIPKVIAKRIERLVAEAGLGVNSAVSRALQPEQKEVVCLYSDIRGYTRAVEQSDDYLRQAAIPELLAMNRIIDDLDGVPRKIGDLLFAYFDQPNQRKNALTGFFAAMNLALMCQKVNQSTEMPSIRRYFLLVSGSAWVGNMGGNDSSVEITALGSPVNLAARLDELTKCPEFQNAVQTGDIVLSNHMHGMLQEQVPKLFTTEINLPNLGLVVRDFPQVRQLWAVRPSQAMVDRLRTDNRGWLS